TVDQVTSLPMQRYPPSPWQPVVQKVRDQRRKSKNPKYGSGRPHSQVEPDTEQQGGMRRRAEEHATRNSRPADAAMLPHEAEVQKPRRQEQDDRRGEAGIILTPPKRHAEMKNAVREEEAGCSQARPDEAAAPPHGDQEW